MYWQGEVVAFLRECKDIGMDFDHAWGMAMSKHPPRGTGFGNGRKQQTLFSDDPEEPSLVEFLEAACRDAWHNEKPQLAGLSVDLLDIPQGAKPRPLRSGRPVLHV